MSPDSSPNAPYSAFRHRRLIRDLPTSRQTNHTRPQRKSRTSSYQAKTRGTHPDARAVQRYEPDQAPSLFRGVTTWFRSLRVPEAAAVRSLHFLLEGEARTFYESFAARGTLSATRSRKCTWPPLVHSLLDRYLTDSDLQEAHDRVTLIWHKGTEDENAYAARIISASYDCLNVFEDHTLVHYYVRGLDDACHARDTQYFNLTGVIKELDGKERQL